MSVKQLFLGNNMDRMPNFAFRMMSLMFMLRDRFGSPERKLDQFGIKPGDTVIDYGCGPGSFIRKASSLVGGQGRVFAVDIHELAIAAVEKRKATFNLSNVSTVLVQHGRCAIADQSADLIYALDMFHMIKDPGDFLRELHRMLKQDGRLIIEDGHQPRQASREKILASELWRIKEETKGWLVCTPI